MDSTAVWDIGEEFGSQVIAADIVGTQYDGHVGFPKTVTHSHNSSPAVVSTITNPHGLLHLGNRTATNWSFEKYPWGNGLFLLDIFLSRKHTENDSTNGLAL